VSIVSEEGAEVARGLARYDAGDVKLLAGGHTQQIAERVENHLGDEVVHRDDIVLTKKGG
jgi:glutamate 5-kinase